MSLAKGAESKLPRWGRESGISWGNGLYAPAPMPAPYILVPCAVPSEARALTLRGAFVQFRGPWRIPIQSAR